ncbi:MAG: hypothetical protein J4F42_22530 [Desulfurellaceae bacterium]|jgi:hypothetical protein|nr:hypothetical protein [Desulfurellaceae bacterium]
MTRLLDPTSQVERKSLDFAPRLESLAGTTIGLLDINKAKGEFFLDRLEEVLVQQYGVKEVLRRRKVTPGRTVPVEVKQELLERCDAVIEALSD